ncbi:MAG: hypothetical protein F6K31_43810 [Symploca sp. SIO2G7]|nr:hypothetical protein [Symploca sp. SIO2G7]
MLGLRIFHLRASFQVWTSLLGVYFKVLSKGLTTLYQATADQSSPVTLQDQDVDQGFFPVTLRAQDIE